jgi:hypothetical protein
LGQTLNLEGIVEEYNMTRSVFSFRVIYNIGVRPERISVANTLQNTKRGFSPTDRVSEKQ